MKLPVETGAPYFGWDQTAAPRVWTRWLLVPYFLLQLWHRPSEATA